jgi:hypothetical protein
LGQKLSPPAEYFSGVFFVEDFVVAEFIGRHSAGAFLPSTAISYGLLK